MLERPHTRKAWLGGAVLTALGLAGIKPGPQPLQDWQTEIEQKSETE